MSNGQTRLLPLNAKISRELYSRHSELVKPRLCYNNIFQLAAECLQKFRNGEYKIAYGYVSATRNIFCRHCFIFSDADGIIDPTTFAVSAPDLTRQYYISKIFENIEEYVSTVCEADGYPALEDCLYKEDQTAKAWGLQNGYLFTD